MKTTTLILLAFLITNSCLVADPTPDTLWTRTYGGMGFDRARDVQQTTDGGYIIAGHTDSFGAGNDDAYIIRTNNLGNEIWSLVVGGNREDRAYVVDQTIDGGYAVAGRTESFGLDSADFWLIRVDSQGDTLWTRTYGGSGMERAYGMQQTTDGGFILAGYTSSYGTGEDDCYLVKTDGNGDTVWTRTYGGDDVDWAYSVQQTRDGGYILAGYTESFGTGLEAIYLIKTDEYGDTTWTRTINRSTNDKAFHIRQTTDGGYIMVADTPDGVSMSAQDILVVKTDSLGERQWWQTLGQHLMTDVATSIKQCDGYVLTGLTQSFGALSNDVILAKFDGSGNLLWRYNYGGYDSDEGYAVEVTADGGFIFVGDTWTYGAGYADFWVVKTGPDLYPEIELSDDELNFGLVTVGGQAELPLTIYSVGSTDLILYDIIIADTIFNTNFDPADSLLHPGDSLTVSVCFNPQAINVYYATLTIHSNADLAEIVLLGAGTSVGVGQADSPTVPTTCVLNPPCPNPFNPTTTISYEVPTGGHVKLVIYNLLGRQVATLVDCTEQAGTHTVTWDANNCPSGIYFCRMSARTPMGGTPSFQQTKKLLLLK